MTYRPSDTQVVKVIKRMRSRYLLPMEMVAFAMLSVLGLRGGLGAGYLHQLLDRPGDAEPWSWLLSVGLIGFCGIAVSSAEWWLGESWDNGLLRRVIYTRMWLSGLAFVMWLYAVYEVAVIQDHWVMLSVVWSAIAVCPFHLWSWWVNYRTHCILNPTMRTSRLENRLESRPPRW
ncbi:MAG TPA: hypothetical protein VF151_10915 [Gemmatimonadales bacterium]